MKAEVIVLIGTLAGVLVGSLGTLAATWIRLKSEERKHQRELVFNAGIENFKQGCELVRLQGGRIVPLDDFLIHMVKFSELIIDKKVDKYSVENAMREMDEFMDKIKQYRLKKEEKQKQK